MENAPLSILSALFGGKPAGDKSTGAHALFANRPDKAEAGGQGFFSFIDGLLKTADGGDETADLLGSPAPFSGAPLTLESLQAKTGDLSVPGGAALTENGSGALDLIGNAEALAGAPITNNALAGQNLAPVDAPAAGDVPASLTNDKSLPAASAMDASADARAGFGTAPGDQKVEFAAQASVAKTNAPGQEMAAPGQTVASAAKAATPGAGSSEDAAPEADPSFDTPRGKSDDAPGRLLVSGQNTKTPGLHLNPHANATVAIADHASPEALSHSAVTRDEGGLEFDRLASTKLEAVAAGADRAPQINPVRDQIVAAVAARQSDGRLEVRLDPPELGRVTISFDRDGAEMVRAVISADTPETLDLMRRHADVLQRALEEQGFDGLDLHFADKGADENMADETPEQSVNFRLAEAEAPEMAALSAPQAALGRLDRRL